MGEERGRERVSERERERDQECIVSKEWNEIQKWESQAEVGETGGGRR